MNKAILFSILSLVHKTNSLVHKTNADDYYNYQGEHYYQDEDEDEDDIVDQTPPRPRYTFLLFVFIFITSLMLCFISVCKSQNRYRHLAASVQMTNPSQSFPIPTPSEGKQVRRQYVLMNIIHKVSASDYIHFVCTATNILPSIYHPQYSPSLLLIMTTVSNIYRKYSAKAPNIPPIPIMSLKVPKTIQ